MTAREGMSRMSSNKPHMQGLELVANGDTSLLVESRSTDNVIDAQNLMFASRRLCEVAVGRR